jgi:hypothetical protein
MEQSRNFGENLEPEPTSGTPKLKIVRSA